jgi:tripartite-type tricarboxylate transporter receptor subunit TctC
MQRFVILLLMALLALAPAIRPVVAQQRSENLLRIVVPFAPGGTPDVISRIVGAGLAKQLGQTYVIENKPGAGGVIGTNYTISQNANSNDTLMFVDVTVSAITPSLRRKLRYDFLRDLKPVSGIAKSPLFLVAGPSLPVKTLPEFIAHIKAHPDIDYGSPNVGGPHHLLFEYLKHRIGIEATHVPYETSAQLLNALMKGEIGATFMGAPGVATLRDASKDTKVLATVGAQRTALQPDVPTFEEFGVQGFTDSALDIRIGLMAPATMSDERVAQINAAVRTAISEPEIAARFGKLGFEAQPVSSQGFRGLVASDTQFFKGIADRIGLKIE